MVFWDVSLRWLATDFSAEDTNDFLRLTYDFLSRDSLLCPYAAVDILPSILLNSLFANVRSLADRTLAGNMWTDCSFDFERWRAPLNKLNIVLKIINYVIIGWSDQSNFDSSQMRPPSPLRWFLVYFSSKARVVLLSTDSFEAKRSLLHFVLVLLHS